MNEWVTKQLGEIVTLLKGRKVNTSPYPLDGYREYLGAGKLSGSFDGYGSTFLAVQAEEADVLMLWDGERSGLCRTRLSGVVSSTVCKLTPTGSIDSLLLYYLLVRQFWWIQHRRTGTGVPHVPKDLGRILTLSYPKRPEEQRKIARILQTIDRAIEKTEALIDKYQQIKKGLMQDLFTRGIGADGQLRPTSEQAPNLYQKTPIGWIPKEWDCCAISEFSLGSLVNGVFKEPSRVGTGVPLVNVADLYKGDEVNLEQCELFDATKEEIARFDAKFGDIFFTRSSLKLEGIAQTSFLNRPLGAAVFECHVMRLRPDANKVKPKILKEWCLTSYARRHFMAHAKQVTMATISQDGIFSLLCPKIPVLEQEKIVTKIESIENRLNIEGELLKKLKSEKKGLMDDLLTRKVPVRVDPENEPELVNV